MNCQVVRTYLSAFMDAALPGSKMADIWKHINSCHSCYEVYDTQFVTEQFFSGVITENVPAEYRHSLRARMEECLRNGTKAESQN